MLKEHFSHNAFVKSSNISNDEEENHDIPMENLYYPKRPEDLWFKLSKPFVIRRLGYFDSRRESEVSIVFITMHDDWTISKPKLYASLVYKNKRTIACLELEEWAVAGKMKLKTYEYYVTYVYRTKIKSIPTDEAPLCAKVGLTCTGPMASIPIRDSKPEKHLTYGVCLHQGLYGSNNSQLLIDWIELNIALGAEIITVYFQDVPDSYYNATLPYI
uniref:Glycosyltransferase family 92 protein n=1 Tax=Amphimedon queenslandica TaxID=400682 RepID=A0A1X7V441_AMPQE